jgi:hypothetical protein
MTEIPKITQFSGQIPDKTIMDKITFANSVQTYLNYFNNNFVPESQTFVNKTNTLGSEIQTTADSSRNYADKASNWANADEDVEIESGKYSAKHWSIKSNKFADSSKNYVDKASNWANADEDVEIESGKYSAKHWASKAEAAVAVLPEGTIDDSLIATDKVWSSQKVSDELKKYATNKIDGGNSTTAVDVYIDGGDSTNT